MRRCIRGFGSTLLPLALLSALALPAAAQQGAIEAGVDARLAYVRSAGDGAAVVQIPARLLRVGYMVTPAIMVEPALGLTYVAQEGDNVTVQEIFVNVLWHNEPLDDGPVYAGGGLGLNRVAAGGDSAIQAAIGARAGLKPLIAPNVLGRVGALLIHRFENEDDGFDGVTELGIEIGVSLLVR